MADFEAQLEIAPLGTREKVIKVSIDVAVTQGDDTTTTVEHTFDKPFVNIPKVIGGAHCTDLAALESTMLVTDITKTTIDVSMYQVLEANLVTGTYVVEVDVVGWVAA